MKSLNKSTNIELQDYAHYFRGFSFKEKKLLEISKKELNLVSPNFKNFTGVKILLGEILLAQGQYEKAKKHFTEIKDLPLSYFNDYIRSAVYHNLGLCYFHLKDFVPAEHFLLKGAQLQTQKKDTIRIISSYMDIANLYYEQYKDDMAIPYFKKAYDLSQQTNDNELKQNSALNMSVLEENRKNFSRALSYRKEHENWKDSLNNQNKVWALAQLEKKFAITQKEKEIKLLQIENKVKIAERNAFLISSIFLIVLFCTGIYFFRQKIKSNRIILSQKKDLDQLNLTKDKLFSIVSHDLRSSVHALKSSNQEITELLAVKNFNRINVLIQNNSDLANSVYNLLDNLLNWSLLQTKQLYFYKESLHLFSVVQQIEYNYKALMSYKEISFECNVPKDIFVFADLDSLKIIIRNLLDNAIKFSKRNGEIKIYVSDKLNNSCNLIVQDYGSGMNDSLRKEILKESILLSKKGNDEIIGTGLGLQLCKTMIRNNDGLLFIESEENIGTKIIIQLQTV